MFHLAREVPVQAPSPSDDPVVPFEISLRIRHPSIDPAEVSRALDLEPIEAFRAGDPRPGGVRALEKSIHAETVWVAVLGPESWPVRIPAPGAEPSMLRAMRAEYLRAMRRNLRLASGLLDWALAWTCARLRARHADFVQRIRAEGGEVALLVMISPREVRSFSLLPAVGAALTELGISIELAFAEA